MYGLGALEDAADNSGTNNFWSSIGDTIVKLAETAANVTKERLEQKTGVKSKPPKERPAPAPTSSTSPTPTWEPDVATATRDPAPAPAASRDGNLLWIGVAAAVVVGVWWWTRRGK